MLDRVLSSLTTPAAIACMALLALAVIFPDNPALALGAVGIGPLVDVAGSKVTRKLGTIDFAEGASKQLRIDQDGVLTNLRFRLDFTITNGGSAAVLAKPYALSRWIKRLDLSYNGQDIFQTIDGPHMVARQILEKGCRPFGMDATVVLTGSAATAYSIVLDLPQSLPRAMSPLDTALDFRRLRQVVATVLWGSISDIYGTVNGAAVSGFTCTVEGTYLINPPADAYYFMRDLAIFDWQVSAANTDFAPQALDRGQYWLRSLNIMTDSDSVLVNTILNNVILKAGTFSFLDRSRAMLNADQAHEYQMALAERATGVYRAELPLYGSNKTLIYMGNPASPDLFLRFDVSKPGTTDYLRVSREGLREHPN